MIVSFEDEISEHVFNGVHTHGIRKKFPSALLLQAAEMMMDILNSADSLDSLKAMLAYHPDNVVRDVDGKYSVMIDENHRVAFRWINNNAEDVKIL